jgi:hypothetical protein
MPNYTFDLLTKHFVIFQKTLYQTWNHIQSSTLYQFQYDDLQVDPYIAEIVICSELPSTKNQTEKESFTSSVYITKSGDVIVKGADYFDEVKTWLRKITMAT